jgi:VWFA-related protein
MRTPLVFALFLALAASAAGHAAQDPQRSTETFRSRVDLIAMEVAALDGSGRPVEDLRPRDFTVKIDGRERPVVSAELVKVERSQPGAVPVLSPEGFVTTNVATANSRRVAVAVDQTLITPGSIVPLLRSASGFVEELTPQDYAALITFPEPGPRVDFTTDKARVGKGIQSVVGQPAKLASGFFTMSLTETVDIADKERTVLDTSADPETAWRSAGPTIRRVMERGCRDRSLEELMMPENGSEFLQCLRDLANQAAQEAQIARADANISLRRLESFLAELIPIEGPKSLILVSAGMLIENLQLLDEAVRLAAAGRTSISVIAVDLDREQEIKSIANSQGAMKLFDRSLELQGLETVADSTGGTFTRFRAGTGEGIFDRLETGMSAWYIVAVERRPGDPERQRIQVEVKRKGVEARSSRMVVATSAINASRPKEEILRDALSSPIAVSGVPLRVSTFAQRDATTGKYRLHIAAQVGQPGTPSVEYSVGYVVMNADNRPVTSLGRRLQLSPAPGGGPNEPLHFDTALLIDPGAYSLRFGVVDPDGRRGTVIRRVELEPLPGEGLKTSDLVVGDVVAEGDVLHPSVEPRVRGQVASYLELYLPNADPGGLTVALEIAEGEASPALATTTLNIGAGSQPDWRVASGIVDVGVLPGRYVARATVRREGKTVRTVSRPFVLEPTDPTVRRQAERRQNEKPGVPITPEMQRQTASYVAQVVGNLTNVTAQEDFALKGPDRQIRSQFQLVPHPGSNRDLLPFRHVTEVNGKPLPDETKRLAELFQKPVDLVRNRVSQITLAAEDYVPSVLNPIFVLAALQADFQGRFEWTVNAAGAEWPAQVKAVTFVERARPTLLRAGPLRDLDAPTRGTAWIEEGTGRLLQSELQIGTGRSAMKALTKFKLDDRLQIMVPDEMRTENPSGVAIYSNYRRFAVDTLFVLPDAK